jgi:hypothetical protein
MRLPLIQLPGFRPILLEEDMEFLL